MTPQRWQLIDRLFKSAIERTPSERAVFLAEACDDNDVRAEVESLISAHEQTGEFLDAPAFEVTDVQPASDPAMLAVGQTINHYKIIGTLGVGGMGEVYLAHDTRLDRKIALKLLPADFARDEQRVRRFEQEARAASALSHPNVCVIHEIGDSEDGRRFIALEHVDGITLRQRMAQMPLKLKRALDIAGQIAAGLEAAHAAGIIHRDIKPENVMLRNDGLVKVLDFGLAKRTAKPIPSDIQASTKELVNTHPGAVMGTVAYMSPEQVRGLECDARTDIWSLAVMLYEMVTGKTPFAGATSSDVIVSILEREPLPLRQHLSGVPPGLQRIVGKALCKDRGKRYQVVEEMRLELKNLGQELEFEAKLAQSVQPAPPSSPKVASTVPLRGYGMVTSVKESDVDTAASQAQATATARRRGILSTITAWKWPLTLALAVLIVVAGATYLFRNRAPALTEKDTVLIADFSNTTGDAVFDGTLKQGLAVQLEQSPFLKIFPDERVRETLRFMDRSSDERVTRDLAREVCLRQGIKAMLQGSITSLGSHYVIALEAINAQTSEVIALHQVEAASKEQVLQTLGQAATKLREKLGESLPSIQKFDVPIEQVTTSSLEALKAFSLATGQPLRGEGTYPDWIATLKRAIELDPKFARAYVDLATNYANYGRWELAVEYAEKAYQLRERTSEREKMLILSTYYGIVTGESDKRIEAEKLWAQTYPRDARPHGLLADEYTRAGQSNQAIEEARESIRLDPDYGPAYQRLATGLINLDRADEAKETINQALARKLDSHVFHSQLYVIGFVQGDSTLMKQQLDWFSGRGDEYQALGLQAQTAAYAGRLRESRLFSRRGLALAKQRNLPEAAAQFAIEATRLQWVVGFSGPAKEDLAEALTLARGNFMETFTGRRALGSLTLALSGEVGQAQFFADEMARRNPKNTLTQAVWLPVNRAAIELQRNNADKTIELLQSVSEYGAGAGFWPIYLRGQAYLRLKRGAEAAAEFQKIIDDRRWGPTSYLYPLAHLYLARAAALTGDTAKSRKAYEDFFALWKDADPDIPILLKAKQEYQRLK